MRRSLRSGRPLAGSRRMRATVEEVSTGSSCHPLRSTGVTRLRRYYEVIRLLQGHRRVVVSSSPPAARRGSLETSLGKSTKLPAVAVSTTTRSRLDFGRRVGRHAHPDLESLTELRLRSALRSV